MKKLSFIAVLAIAVSAMAESFTLNVEHLEVDSDQENPCSVNLKDGKPATLEGDVVFDGYITMSVYDGEDDPSFPSTAKFAMFLRDMGDATNFYVIASGPSGKTSRAYPTTSYCLDVDGDKLAGNPHRITVYAMHSATTYLDKYPGFPARAKMAFVVFVDGQPVQCRDEDYAEKLPQDLINGSETYHQLTSSAKALVGRKMLFISPLRAGYGDGSSQLTAIDFVGGGIVDNLDGGDCTLATLPIGDFSYLAVQSMPEKVSIGDILDSSQTNGLTVAQLFAPAAAGLDDAGQAAYRSLFVTLVFKESGGGYMVMAVPSDEAEAAIKADVDDGIFMIDLDAVAAGKVTLEEVTPGIFYRVRRGSAVDAIDTKGKWAIAPGSGTVEVAIPEGEAGDSSGFFRLEASPME